MRFDQDWIVASWLAEIVGFDERNTMVAREVSFMEGTVTGKPAGKIDLVIASDDAGKLRWYGLEIQAVYFSGESMTAEFESLRRGRQDRAPFPTAVRRPDWRSSGAKRLMPQLQVKGPTLRRWASKIAVAVDRPFFDSIGGPSPRPVRDLDEGDVIWLVPELKLTQQGSWCLERGHWEVLTLEDTCDKLQAAKTIPREAFEKSLREKLNPLSQIP